MKQMNLKNSGRNIVGVLACAMLITSCTKKFEEINTNQNTIATVGASELPFLFSKAEDVATINQGNYQVAQNLFADQYAQYFACVATYFPSDRNVIRMDWVGAAFNPIYTQVVPQLQTLFEKEDPASAEYALANVVWVLAFSKVTDYWGPIPYFQAGIPGTSVPYDPQDKIYDDFFKRLSAAAATLKGNTSAKPYGSYDLIFGGDAAKWLKFTNTLRLRLALRISNVDPVRAKAEAEAAVADGVMTASPADDALILRSTKGGDGNGLSIMSDWNEFRMSASMESYLKGYADPRLPTYFLPDGADGTNPGGTGNYDGVRNGLTSTQLTESINLAPNNSHAGARWASSGFGGISNHLETPQNVIESAEAYFLRAEGSLLGWNMGTETPQQLYEMGITNSMLQWGVKPEVLSSYINGTGLPIAPNDYLNSPPVAEIPVKWSSDPDEQKQQIATQKWLALYPDGMEAWADYRRSRYLKLYPVANSDNTEITNTSTQYIRRIPFLENEKLVNGAEVEKAKALLGGPDLTTTPLWWDKN
jgi:Susd and RagB outer membrane lipoprotein